MTIYYFTISVIAGLGFILTDKKKEKKKTVIYIILSFLILVFTASFRYAIGFDYFSYKNIYETISGLEFNDILNYYWKEPLFFILCKLFCILGCPYHLFLVFLNIFLISAVLWFVFNYSKIPWTSIYFYITLQFLAYNMNLLRQSVALTFFLFAYPFLKDKKIVPYTILIITGGMFHNTLLLLFPFYFLLTKKNTKKYTLLVIVLSVLIYYFFDPFFSLIMPMLPEKYADYFDVSMDYLFARTDNPQGKLYEYRPKIAAGIDEMKQFIEMCFDPQSPMSEKLKQTLLQIMEEDK